MLDFDKFFHDADARLEALWTSLLAQSELARAIREGKINRTLYAIYMIETFHYTAHNARNQALVGVRDNSNPVYTKFCFEHASEEVGHEKMALHDLKSMGGFSDADLTIPRPLAETESLIAYLYWISVTGNPLQRLGYSYWAENCYQYINPLIDKLRSTLSLDPSQLTFFIAHSDIDSKHFDEIKTVIRRVCKSQQDLDDIAYVMEVTLALTGKMLDGVHKEYRALMEGMPSRYGFLRGLAQGDASHG